jgi:hypothetical protein
LKFGDFLLSGGWFWTFKFRDFLGN